ncbi:MAG: hypothetical protein ACYC2T_05035 [Bacillota bacterium]
MEKEKDQISLFEGFEFGTPAPKNEIKATGKETQKKPDKKGVKENKSKAPAQLQKPSSGPFSTSEAKIPEGRDILVCYSGHQILYTKEENLTLAQIRESLAWEYPELSAPPKRKGTDGKEIEPLTSEDRVAWYIIDEEEEVKEQTPAEQEESKEPVVDSAEENAEEGQEPETCIKEATVEATGDQTEETPQAVEGEEEWVAVSDDLLNATTEDSAAGEATEQKPVILIPLITAGKKGCSNPGTQLRGFYWTKEAMLEDERPVQVLAARDGRLYEVRKTPIGVFSVRIEEARDLDEWQEGFNFALPKIDGLILKTIRDIFVMALPNEAMVRIYWDPTGKSTAWWSSNRLLHMMNSATKHRSC